jgi:hypothetical protein
MLVVKQQNGSREWLRTMWNEYTFGMPHMGQQVTLVAPVNLRLRTRDDLETAMQTTQRVVVGLLQRGGDPRPGLGQEHLDSLVVTGKAVIGGQPLMDHGPFQGQIGSQPRLDQLHKRLDQSRLGARSRR